MECYRPLRGIVSGTRGEPKVPHHGHAGRLLGSEQVREEEGMKAAPPPHSTPSKDRPGAQELLWG